MKKSYKNIYILFKIKYYCVDLLKNCLRRDVLFKNINVKLYKNNRLVKTNNNLKVIYNILSNSFTYFEEVVNKITITDDYLLFKRSNSDYEFNLKICNIPQCFYKLKKENVIFDIKCESASYVLNDNEIKIIYKIETSPEEIMIIITKNN